MIFLFIFFRSYNCISTFDGTSSQIPRRLIAFEHLPEPLREGLKINRLLHAPLVYANNSTNLDRQRRSQHPDTPVDIFECHKKPFPIYWVLSLKYFL